MAFCGAEPVAPLFVGVINQHQRVVDHDPGKGHHPHHAHQAEVVAHDQMAKYRADDAEGNGDHDDKRLDVAAEGDGEQEVDETMRAKPKP